MLPRLHRSASRLPNPSNPHRSLQTPPPRIKINDADISISYLKGTGPGGQKINKTNSAVQIIHKPTGIVVKCQATRSQAHNCKTARSLLADRVEALEKGDKSRVALKAEAAKKKKASKMKKTKRKYRELDGKGKAKEDVEEEDEVEIVWDDEVESKAEVGKSEVEKTGSSTSPSTKPGDSKDV
ncbi:hypothetical protein N7452_005536 [Penicillium brevicompactum]|uniref:Prokaryotic-type class I peptide chain release factors domain-containing protein n=1 Tax=Penicillium brevicompactum TaxID=5074 RepID=A0A9W9UF64_PENBR|nr:hypothetical protein N7452_005536 [Penicillium brevicompactum]